MVQAGPNIWKETPISIPNKTEVTVIEQQLEHQRYGNYSGILKVRLSGSNKEYYISKNNFVPGDYWNCDPLTAISYKPFFGKLKSKEPKPVNRDGEWEEIELSNEFFCFSKTYKDLLECYIYKNYKYGYGGIVHYIDPSNVLITY
ncbi:MAG: hypothetical protein H7A25_15755 [Leptospiraceae bacterium]|nr:hypothetical protein [Leptospiraceae bacterium]MCP5501356.1 hypothetical protein [Leptospiraceae bacterium]